MIRLAMICRDEAERLPLVASDLGDVIDSVCLLIDDRTIDATADVAEQLWAHLPGGGIVEPFTFEDFGQARNALLDAAREDLAQDDYLLLLDPDSPISGLLPSSDELTAAAYSCPWRWHGEEWPRVILLRASASAEYIGAAHEVLAVAGATEHIDTVQVEAVVTSGRERLEWIESLLRRDAATSPRSAFHLAQTLADLGRGDEAFGWYLRRAAMGQGWAEETWLATYQAGILIEPLDWQFALDLWQRCIAMRPGRAEAHYQLARAANARGSHSEALSWASLGLRCGSSTDTLRINRWIEREGLPAQFQLAADALAPTPTLPATLEA
jgi:tetratricopeptide (TPR) repeat protein